MIYLYPILSGIILLISFNEPKLWFLGFFALLPLFYFLYKEKLNSKKVFLGSYIFGLIFIGGVIFWFWQTWPLDWAGIENKWIGLSLVFFIWLFSTIVLSFFIALWGLIFYKLKNENLLDILLVSFLWVFFEYLRSFGFSLVWSGKESLIGPHWSLGFLGYILSESNILLPLAGIGGVYLLSFVAVFINALLFHSLKSNAKTFFFFLILFLIFAFANPDVQKNKAEAETLRIAVLNTYFPSFFEISQKEFLDRLMILKDLLFQIKKDEQNPDIVIFPEDSRFLNNLDKEWRKKFFEEIFPGQEKLIIDSFRAEENGKIQSTLFYFNTKNGTEQAYEKIFLMPGGEYSPYLISFLGYFLKQGQWLEEFDASRGYSKGENPVFVSEFRGTKFGALFCSEIMSPSLYRELVKNDAQILINIASHGIFGGSSSLNKQILAMARVRAVENNRYFVRAANFSPSFILDNKGELRAISTQNKDKGSLVYGEVEIIKNKSFYIRFGDWFLLLSFLTIIIFVIRSFIHRKNKAIII